MDSQKTDSSVNENWIPDQNGAPRSYSSYSSQPRVSRSRRWNTHTLQSNDNLLWLVLLVMLITYGSLYMLNVSFMWNILITALVTYMFWKYCKSDGRFARENPVE